MNFGPQWEIRTVSLAVVFAFLLVVSLHTLQSPTLFFRRYGRTHRILGLVYLSLLFYGVCQSIVNILSLETASSTNFFVFDVFLGLVGTSLSYSAYQEFPAHDKVKNPASGVLEVKATVSSSEMLEHTFYQALNLLQIVYIHFTPFLSFSSRMIGLFLVTSPWFARSAFTVNSFSQNYAKLVSKRTHGIEGFVIRFMYRLKKYQYVFYKHFLLHGLNISLAFHPVRDLACQPEFRLYWLGLNIAYVMEFFLQTLVKRRLMNQAVMLTLNQMLMVVTSVAAILPLSNVSIPTALISMLLNFSNRGHELINSGITALSTALLLQAGLWLTFTIPGTASMA